MAESKLHIGKDVWTWAMPSAAHVIIRDPDRKKTLANPCLVWEAWVDHAREKKLHCPEYSWSEEGTVNVTPAMVKVYIERFLLNAGARTK